MRHESNIARDFRGVTEVFVQPIPMTQEAFRAALLDRLAQIEKLLAVIASKVDQ